MLLYVDLEHKESWRSRLRRGDGTTPLPAARLFPKSGLSTTKQWMEEFDFRHLPRVLALSWNSCSSPTVTFF